MYGKRHRGFVIPKLAEEFEAYFVHPDRGPNLSLLPDLSSIRWPDAKRPNHTRRATGTGFDIKLGPGQYRSLEILLKRFEQLMIELKLQDQWFICAGSLIGSMRHHEMVPWDDDIDVCLNLKLRLVVQNALQLLPSEFEAYFDSPADKMYFKPIDFPESVDKHTIGSYQIPHKPWSWPFLDILYLKQIDDIMAVDFMWKSVRVNLSDIYPLIYRPFGRNWYPSPRKAFSFLRSYYSSNMNLCHSSGYSHALEKYISSEDVNCPSLFDKHAFVYRCPVSVSQPVKHDLQFCDEQLIDSSGRALHSIRVPVETNEVETFNFAAKQGKFTCPKN